MKKLLPILAMTAVLVFSVGLVSAAEVGGANTTNWADNGAMAVPTAEDEDVTAGHVYYGDLNTTQNTLRWAGIYGDTSGQLVLRDSNDDTFFQWAGVDGLYVYASEEANVDFTTVTAADENDQDAFIGTDNAADNFTETFNESGVGFDSYAVGTLAAGAVQHTTELGAATGWYTFALADTGGNPLWAATVTAEQLSYDGATNAEYQLLIPEDETGGGAGGATTYYFYLELV